MKKIYIQPEVYQFKVFIEGQLLSDSGGVANASNGEGSGEEPGTAMSKEFLLGEPIANYNPWEE